MDNNSNNDNSNDDDNNNYNEKFDISKYNVISLDNMKNEESNANNDISNNNDNDTGKKNEDNNISNSNIISKEFICMICQRKFASEEKLALHEKLSDLHRQNLNKLKLNNN